MISTASIQRLANAFGPISEQEHSMLVSRWKVMCKWKEELVSSGQTESARSLQREQRVSLSADDTNEVNFALPHYDEYDTIDGVIQGFRTKSLSPVELVKTLLVRIDTQDKDLHSYITLLPELALEQARQQEERMMRGDYARLGGIPYNLKDIIDTAGIRTTCHSRLRIDIVPTRDAAVTSSLKNAGAILLGKTATHEFAFGGPTDDVPFSQPRNPWDISRYAGGSSSGAAVSVAAGLSLGSIGSDTGGSLRIPSSYCGVVSLKPTYGHVSTEGVFPLAPSLDHVGPVARTSKDCAILFEALTPRTTSDRQHAKPLLSFRNLQGLVVGVPWSWIEEQAVVSPSVKKALQKMIDLIKALKAEVREIYPLPLASYRACVSLLTAYEAFQLHALDLSRRYAAYSDVFRRRVAPAMLLSETDYSHMLGTKKQLSSSFDGLFKDCDLILMPATASTAPLMNNVDPLFETPAPSSFSQPTNLSGHPSLTICVGFSSKGLPIGMQLIGPPYGEALLFAAADLYESSMKRTRQITQRPRPRRSSDNSLERRR